MSNDTEMTSDVLYTISVFFRTFGTYSEVLALDALVIRKDITDIEKRIQLGAMIEAIESKAAESKKQNGARRA